MNDFEVATVQHIVFLHFCTHTTYIFNLYMYNRLVKEFWYYVKVKIFGMWQTFVSSLIEQKRVDGDIIRIC